MTKEDYEDLFHKGLSRLAVSIDTLNNELISKLELEPS